ncbi:mechanosensitive ion channel domain-containing protein [Sphingomonas sp. SRS2]|uniref:mechanosensitive ion channel family protein n=1 Tax=Sphingomonas sp. SRS2 TaxID=133190 RepID=UPI00128DA3F8
MIVIGIAVAVALGVHAMALTALRRLTSRTASKSDDVVLSRIASPTRWIALAIALSFSQRSLPLGSWAAGLWQQAAGFILPGLIGWLAIAIIHAMSDITIARSDISVADNLQARRRRTRVTILTRIAIFLAVFLTICMMLLSIPGIRSVGVTLMASAGLAGLAVGAAAQPALKNLIAGVQLAFTEPIRIDDVVIVEGEWGRIEDIRLTFVVIRIWDDRRLVVPVSKFLEESFQNWTRASSQLLGSVFVFVDPATDVSRIRAAAKDIVETNDKWDRRFWNMQVTDTKPDSLEVRVLVTAADASKAFDLRCDVREALMAFIAREMPEAIVRRRLSGRVDSDLPALEQTDQILHGKREQEC